MFDQLIHISGETQTSLNILLLLGLALFGGTMGGRLFQKLRIPQVVGYIAIGIIIGESCLRLVDHKTVEMLEPFSYFALGLIGFMIGGELRRDVIARYGRQFVNILLCEGIGAFVSVTVIVGIIGGFILGDWKIAWALALLLGAIASATAPAATSEVLREYKTRGPLTRTVLGIVAMDDALALVLFAIASSFAGNLTGNTHEGVLRVFINPLYEIGGAVALGVFAGLFLSKLLRKYSEEERMLALSIGAVLFVSGVALALHIDMLLAAMALGVIVSNFTPRKSKDIFKLIAGFTSPIYVLFFVLVGAKLNAGHITLPIIALIIAYLIGRSGGKAVGARLGARISKAPKSVCKYLPLCLFSQAGVAVGLSILASHYFPGYIGSAVVIIVTATAFILEIIGPPFVKLAVTRAGEVGLNVTEEEFTHKYKIGELMDANPPVIYKNMSLPKILKIFSESDNLYYPVIDDRRELLGIITVDSIKNVFMETGLNELLLAVDVMQPSATTVTPDATLREAKESFDKYNVEYLPVVTKDKIIAGFVERRMFQKMISTKLMELQRQADSLE